MKKNTTPKKLLDASTSSHTVTLAPNECNRIADIIDIMSFQYNPHL